MNPWQTLVMTKRNYGTGSLKITDGKWVGQWWSNGHRRKRTLGTARTAGSREGLTKRQAEAELAKLITEPDHRPLAEHAAAPESTVRDIGQRTVERAKRAGKKLSYIESLESDLRAHINPMFGDDPVTDILPADIDRFVSKLIAKKLEPKTIRNKIGTLHAVMERARKDGLRPDNPVDMSKDELPRVKKTTRIQFLTPAELWQVLDTPPSTDDQEIAEHFPVGEKYGGARAVRTWWPVLRIMILTAAMTGLRLGELRGLRWMDVGLKIQVGESFVRGVFDEPKSEAGSRAVPLASTLMTELEEHLKTTAWNQDSDLVFAHPHTGRPLDKARLGMHYKAALRRAEVRQIRFHDLRHTFGTTVAASGKVPVRTLQEWFGHAHLTTTQIYTHYSPAEHEAQVIDDAFARPISHELEQADDPNRKNWSRFGA